MHKQKNIIFLSGYLQKIAEQIQDLSIKTKILLSKVGISLKLYVY